MYSSLFSSSAAADVSSQMAGLFHGEVMAMLFEAKSRRSVSDRALLIFIVERPLKSELGLAHIAINDTNGRRLRHEHAKYSPSMNNASLPREFNTGVEELLSSIFTKLKALVDVYMKQKCFETDEI